MSNETTSLIEELESYLSVDHDPDVENIGSDLHVPSNQDYDVVSVYQQEVIPVVSQVLSLCEDNDIPIQFAFFPKAENGVVKLHQYLCCIDKRPEVAVASLVYTLPHSLSHIVLRCMTSPIVLMESMSMPESPLPFFDKEGVFDRELAPLLEKIGRLCNHHDIPIQWGACVGYIQEGEGVSVKHRNYQSDIPFSPCQVTLAMACYGALPYNLLEDLLDLRPITQ